MINDHLKHFPHVPDSRLQAGGDRLDRHELPVQGRLWQLHRNQVPEGQSADRRAVLLRRPQDADHQRPWHRSPDDPPERAHTGQGQLHGLHAPAQSL